MVQAKPIRILSIERVPGELSGFAWNSSGFEEVGRISTGKSFC
jgi:hypothetical protein